MGYKIGLREKRKDGTRSWRVFYIDNTSQRAVKNSEYSSIGLNSTLTYDQAKAVIRRLNGDGKARRIEAARQGSQKKLDATNKAVVLYLPQAFVTEFETDVLKKDRNKTAKRYWSAAKLCISDIKKGVDKLWKDPSAVYDYCSGKKFSLSYTKKIIYVINLYGSWWGRKTDSAYYPIPTPRGNERERINDAYFDSGKQQKESEPLTPELLLSAKDKLSAEQWNWLFVSVWFGLRPGEIDNITKSGSWKIETHGSVKCLAIYQSKLTSIEKSKRWKYIPILFPEQEQALVFIKTEGLLDRPLVKTVRRHVDVAVTCYGGRKGFVELMIGKGRSFTEVQSWLGHQNIDQTWKNYKNKRKVFIEK